MENIKDKINDFFFHPEQGGGVVLTGKGGSGQSVVTTTITNFAVIDGKKLVRTRTGSVYELGNPEGSLRWIGLRQRRPEIHQKLKEAGFAV